MDFCLYELDGTDLVATAASATGDINLIRDEAAPEQLDADAFVDEGVVYSLALSAAEMAAARIAVYIIDQSNPKIWLDKVLLIETYGHASAQHVFDLGTATVNLSSASEAQIDAVETDTNEIQGKLPTNKIMGSSVVTDKDDEIDAIKTKTDLIGASVALESGGNLAAVKAKTDNLPTDPADASVIDADLTSIEAKIDTVAGYLDAEIVAILADTNELQTDWANGGRLDLLLDSVITKIDAVDDYVDSEVAAIKAVTDTLSLAAIADAVHDETTETGVTLRKAMNIVLAVLAGKSSGGGTANIKFRDQADTKDRVDATVDADGNRTAITNDGA